MDNFLQEADFTFKQFQPRKPEGDSGMLWLATSKSDVSIRHVIKTDPYGLACNEFMYHKVSATLGLFTPEVKLLQATANHPTSAGIRYIPNAQIYEYDARDQVNSSLFYSFLTLYVILNEDDSQEFYVDEQGRVFKLDNASSFNIGHMITIGMGHSRREIVEAVEHMLRSGVTFTEYDKYRINYDFLRKRYGETAGQTCLGFIQKFSVLDEALLDEAFSTIEKAYSKVLSDYYREFVSIRKAVCASFFREMGEQQE